VSGVTYLNHAGTSWPKPALVVAAATRAEAASADVWPALFSAAHEAIAGQLCVPTTALLPTPGCTAALAAAVAALPWQAGDLVLTSGLEHHALHGPLSRLQVRGVSVVELERGAGPIDVGRAEVLLGAGGVRLVAVSMASNVTGELLPFAALTERAHAHGAAVLLDGAQVAGWMPLDLTALGVDLFACSGHKGPQGPMGLGLLYVRPGLALGPTGAPGYCDTGSVHLPALCGLAAGLSWMAAADRLAHARALESRFRAGAAALDRVQIIGGDGPRMPSCSLTVADRTVGDVARGMLARGVVVCAGTHCAPRAHRTLGTQGTVRVSFGPGSTELDVDRALGALAEAIR